ncbi:hypothetical protein SDC9_91527 [bioreactor metagenome]|uniref:Uncharacterized protein n=1 Tax=bioreactor metagenome TaxID=1076179 RepID=A0A644ZV93_9ZZZZ
MQRREDQFHFFAHFMDKGRIDGHCFDKIKVSCIDLFPKHFDQARCFQLCFIAHLDGQWIFNCSHIISQSVRIGRWHLAAVVSIDFITVVISRVMARCDHDAR